MIHTDDVETKEFPRLSAMIHSEPKLRPLLVPLLKASGNNVTGREIALFKYLAGEVTHDEMMWLLETRREIVSAEEKRILNEQLSIINEHFFFDRDPSSMMRNEHNHE
jgi:hypothetical protein